MSYVKVDTCAPSFSLEVPRTNWHPRYKPRSVAGSKSNFARSIVQKDWSRWIEDRPSSGHQHIPQEVVPFLMIIR